MYMKILKRFFCGAICICIAAFSIFTVSAQTEEKIINEGECADFDLSADNEGMYLLELQYETVTGKTVNPQIKFDFTGLNTSYSRTVTLSRVFRDKRSGERFETDISGNELVPRQEEISVRQTAEISLIGGDMPAKLDAGSYHLKITVTSCSVKFYSARLITFNGIDYEAYRKQNASNSFGNEQAIYLEAELPEHKSSAGLIASYDNSTPDISPSASDCTKLGFISAGSREGQWIEWKINVKAAGWYKLVFNYRQNSMRGLGVRRMILLDGKRLFNELDEVIFPYTESFKEFVLSDDKNPYLIYLTSGEHTVRITVTEGKLYESLNGLSDAVEHMNEIYRDILSITGATPDIYRDYNLDTEIPDLIENLKYCRDLLDKSARSIEYLSGGKAGSETAPFDEAIRVIDKMISKPYRIPNQFENFKSQIDAAANQTIYLKQQPLELDTIEFLPSDGKSRHIKYSFFEKVIYRIKIFLNSFTADYTSTAGADPDELLKVWMSVSQLQVNGSAAGREQLQVLKRLCSESFEHQVEFSLVNTNEVITQAIISGKGPDSVLFVPEQTVINLAVRGALADFEEMDEIESIKKRFHPSALVAAEWNGGLFGLPETQSWFMLFCRTDILESCNLKTPNTWDELYYALQVLRQKNMMIGVPEDQRVFEMLLMQQGGQVYNDNLTATRLTEEVSVKAFSEWTDFFVKHSTPVSYDFYNRFRTGEMPLGISDYSLYNQLMVAAPELMGLWKMVPVPGFETDGKINRSQPCNVNSCVVVESSKLKEEAFQFASWWTSDDIQQRFGAECEILLGTSARYNTANLNATAGLDWTESELSAISSARDELWDVKQTPASYYYNRNILNAFRRVVYNYEKPRDVLGRYSKEIDREIERKNKQILGDEAYEVD